MSAAKWTKTKHPHVFVWHERGCAAYDDRRCNCSPRYRGELWNSETKRPDKSERFAHIDEAIGWVADRKRGVVAVKAAPPVDATTVDEFMAMFFAAMERGDATARGGHAYSERTRNLYERDYKMHFAPHVGSTPILLMDAARWQRALELVRQTGQRNNKGEPFGKPLSEHSLACAMTTVKAAYRWGASPMRKLVPTNPTRDLEMPTGKRIKRRRVAAPESIPGLLAAIPDTAVRAVWALAFYAGLRVSEALALDWPNVDFRSTDPVVHVPQSKTDTGRDREIPMVPELVAALRARWEDAGRPALGPIAPGPRERFRLHDETVRRVAAKAWAKQTMPVYTPHEGRHTFASMVAANPACSLADLQKWLGHSSLRQTAEYVQTLPGGRETTARTRLAASFS